MFATLGAKAHIINPIKRGNNLKGTDHKNGQLQRKNQTISIPQFSKKTIPQKNDPEFKSDKS